MTRYDQPIGIGAAKYAGPKDGPFRCDHCIHFSKTSSHCDHPVVKQGPTKGNVEAGGCCSYFRNPANKEKS